MLGFDAIASLPLADDALGDGDVTVPPVGVTVSSASGISALPGGGDILSTTTGGNQPIQVN